MFLDATPTNSQHANTSRKRNSFFMNMNSLVIRYLLVVVHLYSFSDPLYGLAEDVKSEEKGTVSDKQIPSRDSPLPCEVNRFETDHAVLVKEERPTDVVDSWNGMDSSANTESPLDGALPMTVSRKILPGWFGKGVRKGVKRRRVGKS